MSLTRPFSLPLWTVAGPIAACALLGAVWGRPLGGLVASGVAVALIASVMVAVQHAETVAHRVGEPFGALILALAVTVIEVSLIISLKLFGGADQDALARDTVFATVMIVCNGIVGLCLLAGALRNHVAVFRVEGSSPALAVLIPLTTLALVLPQFTTTTAGPTYSNLQLAFAGLMSLILFGVYVFVQTIRHREHFLPVRTPGDGLDEHGGPPAKLVVTGPFAWLRNPIATSTIAQGIGVCIYTGSALLVGYLALLALGWHLLIRPGSEHELQRRFGRDYEFYRRSVRCWLPMRRRFRPRSALPPIDSSEMLIRHGARRRRR